MALYCFGRSNLTTNPINPEPVPATQQLQILRQIHQAALEGQTPQQLCRNAFTSLRSLIDYDRATLLLFDFERSQAQIFATSESESPLGVNLVSTENWASMGKLREGLPYIADDLVLSGSNNDGQILPGSVRSFVTVPLMTNQTLFGALNVCARLPRTFTPALVELIQTLANALALVLALTHRGPRFIPAIEKKAVQAQAGLSRTVALDQLSRPSQTQQLRAVVSSLQANEDRYRRLIDLLPMGIAVYVDWKIAYINPSMVRMMGATTTEQLLNRSVFDFIPPSYRQLLHERAEALFSQHISLPMTEIQVVRLDGTLIDIEVLSVPAIYDGQPAIQAVMRDITERKRADQAFKQAELKYRTLVEQLPAISYIVEFLDHQARMTYISPQVKTLLGFSPEEWLATPDMLIQRLHPDDRVLISSEFQRRHTGEPCEMDLEYRLLTRDDQVVWFRDQTRLVGDETAGWRYLQGIMFDITAQKQLETQFIQAQKMEAVGVLAGGVAHNFNNLLTALIGHTEFALDLLKPDHVVYPDLLSIKKNAVRAANLTQQLLAFTRNQVTQSQVVDLNNIVRQLKPMLAQLISEELELTINLASEPVLAKVDLNQIEQLLINLVANARDAMPHRGQVTIQTAEVTFQSIYVTQHAEIKPGRYTMLAVNDTGVGIAAEVLPRIFDPFFTTKPTGQGTGLGLSTCFGIAKQHGGQITVESHFNRGTSVRLYLPVAVDERPVWIEKLSYLAQPDGTETIMVVEDEPGVRRMTVRVLEQRGYTVLEAQNGPEALRLLDNSSLTDLHLLVTDFIMPHMRGDVLVEQVRERYPGLKVVFISGYGDRDIEAKIRATDQSLYMTKPFEPETLLAQVRLALDGQFE